MSDEQTPKRGFAAMTPEQRREAGRKGGQAANERGVTHRWNSDEAREAGIKGGTAVSEDREHMAEIGRKGGQS
jgi:general stress protein YciG